MPKMIESHRCFIASPGDVRPERDACLDVIKEINEAFQDTTDVTIAPICWENNSTPEKGEYGQGVLNAQLKPEESDIFVCIFGGKIGSPTKVAESGTIEELQRAICGFKERNGHDIYVYFKAGATPIDNEERDKLSQIRMNFEKEGYYYREFASIEELKRNFRQALIKLQTKRIRARAGGSNDYIAGILETRFESAMRLFKGKSIKWIERQLCEGNVLPDNLNDKEKFVSPESLIEREDDIIIKAPPQFGLSALGNYLVLEAWKRGLAWLYLDFSEIKLRKLDVVISERSQLFHGFPISCIVCDSCDARRMNVRALCDTINMYMPGVRIVILQGSLDSFDVIDDFITPGGRKFALLQLLSLTRNEMRDAIADSSLIVSYDGDTVLEKLATELEDLNLHRSPMNCHMLLKVMESNFDRSPINRTQLISNFLFELFNLQAIPGYTERPNLNDCDFMLGGFCELLMREQNGFSFSESKFISYAKELCESRGLEVDFRWLWNELIANRIVVDIYDDSYRFGASFWAYYFCAKQMALDPNFRAYMLENKRYAIYPEIIEFYTGMCPRDTEILKVLEADLAETYEKMERKLGIKTFPNLLDKLLWNKTAKSNEQIKNELYDNLQKSNAPSIIKDQHADSEYDYRAAYSQDIRKYIEGASCYEFDQQLKGLSRAWRNCDYGDLETRKNLLIRIIRYWTAIAKISFILSPIIARVGRASFEGMGFVLKDFKETDDYRRNLILVLCATPITIVRDLKRSLSSKRHGRVFYSLLEQELSPLIKHFVALYLIKERPRDWDKKLLSYINSLAPNSFYLSDVYAQSLAALRYEYCSPEEVKALREAVSRAYGIHNSISYAEVNAQLSIKSDDIDVNE